MSDSTTIPVERTSPSRIVRISLVGVAAAAILAVGILAAGATASPGTTLASGTGSSSAVAGDVLALGRDGDGPGRFGSGPGFGGIEITSISGSKISLATLDGWTRTISVDSGTTYARGTDAIALKDLAVGDEIRFRQTREDDGSWTIDAIAVIPPHAGGRVTAISGSTITVERRGGGTTTIKVTSGTTYSVDGEDASLADVKVGMRLMAEGTKNSDGSLTAAAVRAADPDSMPGPGGRGFGRPGGHGPWGGDAPAGGSAG